MQRARHFIHFLFFFSLGFSATGLVLVTAVYLAFSLHFQDRVYPGVTIAETEVGEMTPSEIEYYFSKKQFTNLIITLDSSVGSVSAKASDLEIKLDSQLMATRAMSVGRQTKNPYYNFLQILSAWQGEIDLPLEINYSEEAIVKLLAPLAGKIEIAPKDAVYAFTPGAGPDKRGRVVAFEKSNNGQAIDYERLTKTITTEARGYYFSSDPEVEHLTLLVPTKIVTPMVTSTVANELGINDLLGTGESFFYDSIPGRVYNIGLGTEKVNGRLIAPGEIFSFAEAIGTVSAVFGFQKAYAIVQGKTALDDGGGVCQVSTTLYRAVLNAGLPVTERVGHSYRVGFYEQGGFKPGMDATVYPPKPDFRFKNDTGKTILIQATFDKINYKLTFELFGTSDGRQATIEGPVIVSTIGSGEPIYQDDPSLPLGQLKQVETAHAGAKVYFKRTVVRNNRTLINETVWTDYVPWPARYLRGTKT